jgi:GTP cyclohydrolase II
VKQNRTTNTELITVEQRDVRITMPIKIYAETNIPTEHGTMRFRSYRDDSNIEPLAILSGYLNTAKAVNLRIHSSCITSEVFGSCKCDCKHQLDQALSYISLHSGLVIYLHQEGRGIGLGDKLRVYALQEQGYDTIEANEMLGLPVDARTYEQAIEILQEQGITRVNLLTNNPEKVNSLEAAGIIVDTRIPIHGPANVHSTHYLTTKRTRMGHLL